MSNGNYTELIPLESMPRFIDLHNKQPQFIDLQGMKQNQVEETSKCHSEDDDFMNECQETPILEYEQLDYFDIDHNESEIVATTLEPDCLQ